MKTTIIVLAIIALTGCVDPQYSGTRTSNAPNPMLMMGLQMMQQSQGQYRPQWQMSCRQSGNSRFYNCQ